MKGVKNPEQRIPSIGDWRPELAPSVPFEAELLSDLGSESWREEMAAQRSLLEMGEQALPVLVDGLESTSEQTRWGAAKLLLALHPTAAIPSLLGALEDPNAGVRWLAAEALAATGGDALAPLLDTLVRRSDSAWLLEGAHHVLRGLGSPLAAPVVRALEGHFPDLAVPVAAHEVLQALGTVPARGGGTRGRRSRVLSGMPVRRPSA